MDVTDWFAALVRGPEEDCRLDLAAALVAAHARRDLDVQEQLDRLDELAAGVREPTLDGVVEHLFRVEGFQGDADDYGNPRNSLLDSVLDRRRGIPITLSLVFLEVARRVSVPVEGVGMPGHFLVRDRVDRDVFVDPFWRVQLDRDGCEALFRAVHGEKAKFRDEYLDAVGNRAFLSRMLTNLRRSYSAVGDRSGALWSQCLRVLVPGATASDRRELASLLAANGRFDAAAEELDSLAEDGWGGDSDRHAARYLRARLN
jgi:regulator of sirC expression with transglutaminase-like and TPR domain